MILYKSNASEQAQYTANMHHCLCYAGRWQAEARMQLNDEDSRYCLSYAASEMANAIGWASR